ncbi:MAG: magnesium transporter CorA family protein [Christensenellaceae bacterium]|nr:magnesium transporter CorA family protein [Christensenellaceae bacterium]
MIYIFDEKDGEYIRRTSSNLPNMQTKIWVELVAPTRTEADLIVKQFGIPEEFMNYALDEDERARVDRDDDTGCDLVIFDTPIEEKDTFATMPVTVIFKGNIIISVCLRETSLFNDLKEHRDQDKFLLESDKLLYKLLLASQGSFSKYLMRIEKRWARIQHHLQKTVTNEEVLNLLSLKNSLTYFATSLHSNNLMINELSKKSKIDDDTETLQNISVEITQAIEKTNTYRELLTETMNAYSSILSNNLNEQLRKLTLITILIAIPTLIFSLWGINTDVPFGLGSGIWGFWVVVGVAVVATLISTLFILGRKTTVRKRKDPR